MRIFNRFMAPDINQGVVQFEAVPDAVLLDVRTPEEYAEGHIPHSKNIPLQTLERAETAIPNKETALFVYCLSGARSQRATAVLQAMGYSNVVNVGGINGYRGKVERK